LGSGISIYRNFSENLHALTVRRGSVADVCRDLAVNRQQFNKYLNGSVIPREEMLGKITKYFGVAALDMFKAPGQLELAPTGSPYQANAQELTASKLYDWGVRRFSQEALDCELKEGVYSYYIPWTIDPGHCLRGLIVIKKSEGKALYTRVFRFAKLGSRLADFRDSVNDGIVKQTKQAITFVGIERRDEHRLVMIDFNANTSIKKKIYTGLSLSFAPNGAPASCRVVLHYVGSLAQLRLHYRRSGILAYHDRSIPSEILGIVENGFSEERASVQAYDLLSKWRDL
jgi:transcriptional regulator with XRE-family HTH domain